MMNNANSIVKAKNKLKLSRRGKKLTYFEESKIITILPKEIPERIWAEILQKEENILVIFEIREEIIENALKIGYYHYMEKQNVTFTVHCAIQAWLQIVDWFPGRVNMKTKPDAVDDRNVGDSDDFEASQIFGEHVSEDILAAESEVLQKITDYSTEKVLKEEPSKKVLEKKPSRMARSSGPGGSGDASIKSLRPAIARPASNKSRFVLPPLTTERRSHLSVISDCRLRSLRLETQHEVSAEKINQSPKENVKRKQNR